MTGPAPGSPSTRPTSRIDDGISPTFERANSWSHRRRSSQHINSNSPPPDEIPLRPIKSHSRRDNRYDSLSDEDDTGDETMSRPSMHRPTDGRSQVPLLKEDRRGRQSSASSFLEEGRGLSTTSTRRSALRNRTPVYDNKNATRQKYIIASFFLIISLVSFTVQTQTAIYIQQELGWNKPYCMLYLTHGSWVLLWPVQLLIIRVRKWRVSWPVFWRRHVHLLQTTARMVQTQDLHPNRRGTQKSPTGYIIRTTALVGTALTIAGSSWYIAVNLTTGSDLTAIYNCSAFFAYAFSIPLLNDKLRFDKVFAVIVAIIGVGIVAYGGPNSDDTDDAAKKTASNRALGNIIIGCGSVLYGLYEVLYKRLACPPEGTSAGRGVIFSNYFASLLGLFTVVVLWIPLPVLHWTGVEVFEWPRGEAGWLLFVSTLSNAVFSGSFLVLISLTSPVLSSVAALLTIFIVALVDWKFNHKELSGASITGGMLIVVAFLLLSWSTYREMDEERRKKMDESSSESDTDE